VAPASDIFDWSEADLYMIMGVSRDADADAVHKAFRKLAKLHHPDRYPLDSAERVTAAARFKTLAEAHDVLSDPGRRAAYDAELDLMERCRPGPIPFDIPIYTPPAPPPAPAADGEAPPPPPPPAPARPRYDPFADEAVEVDEAWAGPAGASFAETLGDLGVQPGRQRNGTSEASKRSAATAYYAQGMRYYGYGEYDRAMRCFLNAMQLDPTRKVSPVVWAKLQRYTYGWD
jgi:curved DNA-binding protein CbpA